jgi:twinkle protein
MISDMLASQAESFVKEMFPAGKKISGEWCLGDTDGSAGESLKIHLTGSKAGLWKDFASGQKGGDLLDLVCAAHNCNLKTALDTACSFLGITRPTFAGHKKVEYNKPEKKASFRSLEKLPAALTWLRGRGFSDKTIAAYKVIAETERWNHDAKKMVKVDAIAFPSIRNGELIHLKYRDAHSKEFWSSAGTEKCLFGWQATDPRARVCYLTEGEADAMALYEYGYPAMSIPFGGGAGAKQEWITNEFENMEQFDAIYLCLDNDEAGQLAVTEIIDRLGRHRCRVVTLPRKDANKCLMDGVPLDQIKSAIENAKTLDPAELRNAREYEDEIIRRFHPVNEEARGFHMPWQSMVGQFRFGWGETTILAGYNGHGKTTGAGHIVVDAIQQRVPTCVASLEFKPPKWLAAIVRQATCEMTPDVDRIKRGVDFIAPHLWVFDVGGKGMGTARVDRILEVFLYARARYGIKFFVIDNFTKLGIAEDDYNGQKEAIVKITEFAVEHDVHVLVVAHLKKAEGGDHQQGGKQGVRGAGAITDLVDNVWIWHRNRKKEGRLKEIDYALRSGNVDDKDRVAMLEEQADLKKQGDAFCYCEKYRDGDDEPRLRLWFCRVSHQFMDNPDQSSRRYC